MKRLMILILIILGLAAGIYAIAGRIDWIEMHIFLATYILTLVAWVVYLKFKAPDLMKERMSALNRAKKWDTIILYAYAVLILLFLITAALDAGRYQISSVPRIVKIICYPIIVLSYALNFWAAFVNQYLSSVVRIQKDRGHHVVMEGPYGFVRHPMYTSIVVSYPLISLFLGSYYALIPSLLIIVLYVIRTAMEDQTLQDALEGYKAYTEKVRYRLIPYIW